MAREEVVAFVRQLQEAANAHDLSRLMDFYAEDAVAVSPVFGEVKGRAAVVGTWETLFATFPDCAIDVSDVFADGDRVVFLGTVTATDRSGWFGLPATGAPVCYRVTLLCKLVGAKIVREERLYDMAGVLERLEKARIDKELQTAAEVQSALQPRTANVGPHWEAVGDSIPCRAIGGDFFELAELPSGDLGVALGDVEGKGTPAALVAAMLHGMFVADAQAGQGPATTLLRMNRQLAARHQGSNGLATRHQGSRFATLVYGVLSPDGRFVYSNAGHNVPALLTRAGVLRLTTGGPILGAFTDASFEEGALRLEAQDTLLMFSDGVTEASNARDEEFGEERLIACATEHLARSPIDMLDRILSAVREFCGSTPQADDITATAMRFRG